jgi:purine nucleosidase
METIPVLFDTDIGSDIDDAVALAYLLRQPRCELLGITTVSGEPHKRASLVSATLKAAGRDGVPVHVGIEAPLVRSQVQPQATQFEALADKWAHDVYDNRQTAIDFLRDTIRARPGEITLLAVGPFTNIGVLFTIDPEIPRLLKEMVVMGGQFFTRGYVKPASMSEWNILCDPHAASIVFNAPLSRLVAVGIDVTRQVELDADECRTRFDAAGGALAPVASMAEVWFRHRPIITFHDPLAATVIFAPSLCETMAGTISVEMTSAGLMGTTMFDAKPDGIHHAATTVSPGAFFEHYFGIVGS